MSLTVRKLVVLILAMSLIVPLTGCQGAEVLAEVNGEKITRSQLDERMLFFDLLRPEFSESMKEESFRVYMENYLLSLMVQGCLVKQEVGSLGLTVDEEVLEDNYNLEIESMIDEFFENEDKFHERLKELKLSESFLKNLVRESLMFELLYDYIISDISEQDARDYFESNKEHFIIPAHVKVSHILVETKEEADEAVNRLESGEDFNKLMEEASLYQDGEFIIEENDYNFDQNFSKAAFQLNVGEISGPVESSFGWHIIKLHEKEDETEFSFEEVKDDVFELKKEEVFYRYINELYEKADIKNYMEPE